LPEVWTCTMNDWDNVHNSCAVPQEADDTSGGGNGNGGNGADYVGDGQVKTNFRDCCVFCQGLLCFLSGIAVFFVRDY
jgi:hypothetical protein